MANKLNEAEEERNDSQVDIWDISNWVGFEEIESHVSKDICLIQPAGEDPILKWLFQRGFASRLLILAFTIILSISPILAASIEGNFFNSSLNIDLSHDYLHFAWITIGIPLILAMVIWYFSLIPRTILLLCLRKVVLLSKEEYKSFCEKSNAVFSKSYIHRIPIACGLAFAIIDAIGFNILVKNETWQRNISMPYGTVAGWLDKILVGLSIYLILAFILRLTKTYVVLKDLFKYTPNIQPLHPDRCGGLAPLGSLCMRLNFGVLFFGFVIIACYNVLVAKYVGSSQFISVVSVLAIAFCFVAYPLGSLVVVFLPLYSTHKVMRKSRMDLLNKISARYERKSKDIYDEIRKGNDIKKEDFEQLERLTEIYKQTQRMPVYPFDTRSITIFITSVLTPIVVSKAPDMVVYLIKSL